MTHLGFHMSTLSTSVHRPGNDHPWFHFPFPIDLLGAQHPIPSSLHIPVGLSRPYLVGYKLGCYRRRGILPSKVMPLSDGITKPIRCDYLENVERLSFS